MNLVRQHCHGYANGCFCVNCSARSKGVRDGALYYEAGHLCYRENDRLRDAQALSAYMRDRKRPQISRAA